MVFLTWLAWASDLFISKGVAPEVFTVCSVLLFIYFLLVGASATADCISRERRDGTLGLLFLTNLNSAEIVLGKLCSNGLALMYSLVGILPVLGVMMFFGGITFELFFHTSLALANTVFFAVAIGFLASTLCLRQFPAVSMAMGLAIFFGTALLGLSEISRYYGWPKPVTEWLSLLCPLHTLLAADSSPMMMRYTNYWLSLASVAGLSVSWLLLVAWRLKYIWRDRPRVVRVRGRFGFRLLPGRRFNASGAAMRRRLLNINPFFWLASRQRISAPLFMLIVITLCCVTEWVVYPYCAKTIFRNAGNMADVGAHMFAWLWTGLAIHILLLFYAATVSSQQLAEDKQNGALELILSTPTTERTITRGLWLAYWRRMCFPVLAAVFVYFYFFWNCATLVAFEPREFGGKFTNVNPGPLIWAVLLDQPVNGFRLDWQLVLLGRAAAMGLIALAAILLALGWVGRWLGVRLKHPGFAPMVALAFAIVPPVVVISFMLYLWDVWRLYRLPERQIVPVTTWLCFGIVLANCAIISFWSARRLRRDLRIIVTSRYQPAPLAWWRPTRRKVFRLAGATAALALLLALAIGFFFGYQNWRGRQNWSAFKAELKQRGESLDLAAILPGRVPTEQNLAESTAFRNFVANKSTNRAYTDLRARLASRVASQSAPGAGTLSATPWAQQRRTDFDEMLSLVRNNHRRGSIKDRKEAATAFVNGLALLRDDMEAIASASTLPYFQYQTNRDKSDVLGPDWGHVLSLAQLQFLFATRANASVTLNDAPVAANDLLTSLRLASLARQSTHALDSQRVQLMLARSFQPLWEGILDHRWNESQLASFQAELARFNLLADYTNDLHRVVLAHIEMWLKIPVDLKAGRSTPYNRQYRPDLPFGTLQPSSWWLDYSINLYRAGQDAASQVDASAGRVDPNNRWINLNGLPLDGNTQTLFNQQLWAGVSTSLASFSQNSLNQAVLACALERYRLANAQYPNSLALLVPAYLGSIPRDVLNGKAMYYRRTDDGGFELRGVGPNGSIDLTSKASSDDWLWSTTVNTNTTSAPTGRAIPVAQPISQ